ncbi:hypothetical protein [Alteromonas mediterranea]|uniref:hypothetical protein n=1 Tax=Alteromonas mediterranea TaxID=314275 RepID=UPI0012DB617C|nr:hypothetical protein [Alteromonas mediterranea]
MKSQFEHALKLANKHPVAYSKTPKKGPFLVSNSNEIPKGFALYAFTKIPMVHKAIPIKIIETYAPFLMKKAPIYVHIAKLTINQKWTLVEITNLTGSYQNIVISNILISSAPRDHMY